MRQPSLLFGGLALDRPEYLALWKTLDADPKVDEVVRNYPFRQPVLWSERPVGKVTGQRAGRAESPPIASAPGSGGS